MIKGITFRIQNNYSNILEVLTNSIDVENMWWYIYDNQIFTVGLNEFLFDDDIIDGELFERQISKSYYPVFGTLMSFKNKESIKKIEDYNDFIKSECNFIIIFTDVEFVEIYCKDNNYFEIFKNNIDVNQSFCDIKYLDKLGYNRTNFDAM